MQGNQGFHLLPSTHPGKIRGFSGKVLGPTDLPMGPVVTDPKSQVDTNL